MPNVVEILVSAKNLTGPAFAEVKASGEEMNGTFSKLSSMAGLAAGALVGFVGESVKMATEFDAKMSLLQTQAGVSQDKIAGLKSGVLQLAGEVGQNPDSLAESLYHVESNFESMGITSQKALEITKVAAEGAAVGHANLVDVTNALTAAVASGIPGVQDMSQAMGILNATVGVGDMSMQDLAKAFGSGMVATVKGYGLNIQDVAAALATFGDNNIRGANAGTQLRMTVQALATPVASAGDALKRLGLTQTTLADDMQKGGLKLALEDLQDRMIHAGISADQQGQIITEAFGRKAGAGLNVLLSQMDRLESKYPALEAGANGFGDAWKATQATFSQQMKELQGSLDAMMISLGEKLLPVLSSWTQTVLTHKQAVVQVAEAVGILAGALTGLYVFNKILNLVINVGTAFKDLGLAMVAYRDRMIEIQAQSELSGGSITRLGAAFEALGTKAKLAVGATAVGLVAMVLIQLQQSSEKAAPDVDKMTTSLGNLGEKSKLTGELTTQFGSNLDKLGYAVDRVAGKSTGMDAFNDTMNKIFSLGMAKSNSLTQAKSQIDALDQGLANLVQQNHADLAAAALKRLTDQLAAHGGDPSKLTGELTKYSAALQGTALQQNLAADAMGPLGQQAIQASNDLQQEANTAAGLKQAIIDLNDTARGSLDSQAAFQQSIADATKAMQDNGRALSYTGDQMNLTTDASRAEEKALTDLASKTDAAAEAALNNGESMDTVNQIYGQGRDKLIQLAQQMGLTKDQAKDLADQILATPDKTAMLRGNMSDLQDKLNQAQQELANAPSSKQVDLRAEISGLESDIQSAQDAIDSLTGKTVTVTTQLVTINGDQYAHGMAHGGIVGAAGGGPRSGLTWVGEQGPELVRLPYGSTVYPAGQSANMAAAAAHGGPAQVQLEINSGGARLDDLLLEILRKAVRIRGGNVQTVLGQG
jgi:TP901 family phage tail tape measure protein